MRQVLSLNNEWTFYKDCASFSEKKKGEIVNLPHTWNGLDGQDGGNDYWRGTTLYEKEIELSKNNDNYLVAEGISASASFFLNGEYINHHDGGFSTINVELTPFVKEGKNILSIFVDNAVNDSVYPQTADFTFYGGIYRDIKIISFSSSYIPPSSFGSDGVDITTELKGESGYITIKVQTKGEGEVWSELLDSRGKTVTSVLGKEATITLSHPHLWNGKKDPYLYTLKVSIINKGKTEDCISHRIGFRSFYLDSQKGFFLNGESYPLRGVSMHQDRPLVGWAITNEMIEEDISLAEECGANAIRAAHYEHSQYFYDLCDEKGLFVWAEIPFITKYMKNGEENTISQMKELITECKVHPSIYTWAISNEITAGFNNDEVYENNKRLLELCHSLDSTRVVSQANAFMLDIKDKMATLSDAIGYNLYYGWYVGEIKGNKSVLDSFHEMYPGKSLSLTEFGADANILLHSSNPVKGDYSEEYQAYYHEEMCRLIDSLPYLAATYVWNMFDFAADARKEGGTKGLNTKGLVTFDRKTKKDSFYVLKAWYSDEPFVHIASKRYLDRTEEIIEVKVYSNLKKITLYINDKKIETKKGDKIFIFKVPLKGDITMRAVSGKQTDEIKINKVQEENTSYFLSGNKELSNWFIGLELKYPEGKMSILNTFGEIMAKEEGRKVVDYIFSLRPKEKAGVAGEVEMTEYMMTNVIKDVTVIEMLEKGGYKNEDISSINRLLNKIEA